MADKNVLILEKDDKFLKALKLYFRGSNYDATSTGTDDEFLASIRQRRPDIVLVAVESDDGDARTLFRNLGQLGLPIVIMSSKKDETDLFAGGLATVGAHGYIKKPFIKKAILEKLDEVASAAPASPGGMDLGSVLTEMDSQFEGFSPGGSGEVTISLDEETQPEVQTLPGGALAFEAPAEERVRTAATPAPAPPEPIPADVPAEIRRLRERVHELERELLGKSEEYKKIEREKEQLDRSVGKKESELIEKIKSLERSNEELEEDVRKRKNLVAQMTASVQQLNEELEEKDKKHDRVIDDWKQQVAKVQTELDAMSEKSSNQAHDIEDKTDEIARNRRRIEDLEAERSELQSNLEKMTEAKGQADQNIERLESELATERGRIAAGKASLERGLGSLREKLLAELGGARDALERGLSAAREAAETEATRTQEETTSALLGGQH